MIKHIEGGVICDDLFCDGKHGICPRCRCFKRKKKQKRAEREAHGANEKLIINNE